MQAATRCALYLSLWYLLTSSVVYKSEMAQEKDKRSKWKSGTPDAGIW